MAKRVVGERHQRCKVNAYLGESALGENTAELISIELIVYGSDGDNDNGDGNRLR